MLSARTFLATAALTLIVAATTAAQVPTALAVDADSAATAKLEASLDHKVTLDFVDVALKDVISSLADQTNVSIVLPRNGLGIEIDHPVSIRLKDVKLKSALRTLLDDLNLKYLYKDEIILIVTGEKYRALERPHTKVYPVKDLITTPGKAASGAAKLDFDPSSN